MFLSGLQKLTLLDYPGKVACTVFTAGCNFRCPFCHNASLVRPESAPAELPESELLSFLARRQGLLDGVAVSGGEPLLHTELPALLEKIKALGYAVKLDTNGSLPERLEALLAAGLVDYVAMDIKNGPSRYAATTGTLLLDIGAVDRSRALLMEGRVPFEFRTTVVRGLHSPESLEEAARWLRGAPAWYLQSYRPEGDILAPQGLEAFTDEEITALAQALARYVPTVRVRGISKGEK